MTRPALLAVSHGTDDAAGAAAIALLVQRVSERLNGAGGPHSASDPSRVEVRSGFVDVQQPDAPTALAARTTRRTGSPRTTDRPAWRRRSEASRERSEAPR